MWGISPNNLGPFLSFASLPSIANDGDIAYIPQLVGSEYTRMRFVASSGIWVVEPGQAIINAYNIFEVVSAPSTATIIYSFPLENGLFQPGQTWRIDAMASGVIGAANAGFRTTICSNGANTAKTQITSAVPRARSNKTFSRRPNGTMDFFEIDSANHTANYDAAFSATIPPQVVFEPGQAGDSFMLRTYVLRRFG